MSIITCSHCNKMFDTDYDQEHVEECRLDVVWDELLDKMIDFKNRGLITEKEYKIMHDDMEMHILGGLQ